MADGAETTMHLTILGSGTCVPSAERYPAAYLLEMEDAPPCLVDAGGGAPWRLAQTSVSYRSLDTLLLSHAHPDHTAGIVPLVQGLMYTPDFTRTAPLRICGLQPVLESVERVLRAYPALVPDFPLDWVELTDGAELAVGRCGVSCRELAHAVPVLGYRFTLDGLTFAYATDTGPCDALIALLQGADAALVECSFPRGGETSTHLTTAIAGEAARQAGVGTLVLTHFYPRIAGMTEAARTAEIRAAGYTGGIVYARDLMRIPLG